MPTKLTMSRVGRAILSWFSSLGLTAFTMVIGFVATPFILKFLGAERLGASKALLDWVGFLQLADLALIPAITVVFLRHYGNQQQSSLLALLKRGLLVTSYVVAACLPCGVLLIIYLPHLIPVPAEMATELQLAGSILLLMLVLSPMRLLSALLEVMQRSYHVKIASLLQSTAVTGLSVWLAYINWGLVGIAIANVTGVILLYTVCLVHVLRSGLSKEQNTGTLSLGELFKLSWPFAVLGISTKLNFMTDNAIVTKLMGPAATTSFFLTMRLMQLTGGQVTALAGVTWAPLGELRQSNHPRFVERVFELSRLMTGLAIVGISVALALTESFVSVWVGSEFYGGKALALMIAVNAAIGCHYCFFHWIIDTAGLTAKRLHVNMLAAVANIALSVWLGSVMGMAGVVAGTVIAIGLTDAWYGPYLVCREFDVAGRKLAATIITTIVRTLPWLAGIYYIMTQNLIAASWSSLIAASIGLGVGGLTYIYLIVFNRTDRAHWRERIAQLI